ncbi:hypothetical protein PUN28_002863 [Cardiocondyla obscurior]|uniref:Uncharacterized protein n=1 Tax=Cardiocondyla obscurior TaxID=286306 RepID=A0AAW2GWF9_9HYME
MDNALRIGYFQMEIITCKGTYSTQADIGRRKAQMCLVLVEYNGHSSTETLMKKEERRYLMNMVEIQQRGIEFLRSVQKVGTSYRALGLAERSSTDTITPRVPHGGKKRSRGIAIAMARGAKPMTREANVISTRGRTDKICDLSIGMLNTRTPTRAT